MTSKAAVLRGRPLPPPPARPLGDADAAEGVEERLDGVGHAREVHAEHVEHAAQGLHQLLALVTVEAGVVDLVVVIVKATGKRVKDRALHEGRKPRKRAKGKAKTASKR